ncbi:chemerin-like receptor 1 isoform X2 [Salminus brasiliensis]
MTSSPETETDYPEYDYESPVPAVAPPACRDAACIFLAMVNVMIFILGCAGNGLVIWIAGLKLKKSVNTTWYLSLAVFISFILFLNMFSSIFLLVIISVDRCMAVVFPMWAQNLRTIRKASVIVTLVWVISAALSTPSLVFRDVRPNHEKPTQICYNNYNMPDQRHTAIVAYRFMLGFLIPFLIIIICYIIIIRKLESNQVARSKKPFKIMTALIVTYFICWLPFHIIALMELNHTKYKSILSVGQMFGATLASANSCLNPFLYAFMGKDFKNKWYAFLSKIENAIMEVDEARATV